MKVHWSSKFSFTLILLLLFTPLADAEELLKVTQVTMPKLPPVSSSAAIYLMLENLGDQDLSLIGVETAVAQRAMIHKTSESNGMVSMQHIARVEIPAGGKLVFEPGSYHIMLMGLEHSLINKPFTITLKFAQSTQVTVKVNP